MHFHSCVPAFFAYHLDIIKGGAEETHFTYKNNFIFNKKEVLITQKRKYFNAF